MTTTPRAFDMSEVIATQPTQPGEVVDLFGGPGGWAEALRSLGLTEFGLDTSPAAIQTRRARGHRCQQQNVATADPRQFVDVWGLIGSPPCWSYSSAGLKDGQDGETGPLVWEPLRWASVLRPEWIAPLSRFPGFCPSGGRTVNRWSRWATGLGPAS